MRGCRWPPGRSVIDHAAADVASGAGHKDPHDFTLRRAHDTIDGVKAVLGDMDGTLVDSEKIWDISLAALYDKLGGELTPAVRASMVGSVAETTMRIVYTDLGLDLDPAAME